MKKTLIIAGIAVALIILGLFIFNLFSGDTPTEETPMGFESPFGSGGDVVAPNLPNNFEGEIPRIQSEEGSGQTVNTETKFFRLSNEPVAGFVAIARGTTTAIRYVERGTGHIFEYLMPNASSSEITKKRITNATLPKIYEAYFRPDGNAVLMRTLEGVTDFVRNFTLTLTPPQATSTPSTGSGQAEALHSVTSTNLRGDVISPNVRADGSLLYVLGESASLISSNIDGSAAKTLANLGITGWRILPSQGGPLIQTKSSAELPGFLYSAGSTGVLSKIVGPLYGLTATANRAGNRIIYSYYSGGGTRTFALNRTGDVSVEVSPNTLAEKCVWSELSASTVYCGAPSGGLSGAQPDSWYQGRSEFSDFLWSFDATTESSELITEPKGEFGLNLDVSSPKLSSDERYIFFINRTDLSLWAVKMR